MIFKIPNRWAVAILPILGSVAPIVAAADTESQWVESPYADSRLISSISAVSPDGTSFYIGWEVMMPPEWKTYWRSPGDAGRPARLDWEGSINLQSAELLYPFPEQFRLFDIATLGYAEHVIFPIRVTPGVADAPVLIELRAEFMSCMDICVPLEASYRLKLDVAEFVVEPTQHWDAIRASLSRVPLDASDSRAEISIRDVELMGPAGRQNLVVSVQGVELLSGANLLIEGGPGIRFDEPRRSLVEDGLSAVFVVPVGGASKAPSLGGKSVVLTFADGWGRAIEQEEELAQ